MTYQPGEQPYTQPQDPWSGAHGTASAPTEPMPAPVRSPDQFAPGVASPVTWSQETIAHRDPAPATRSEGSRAGLYVFVGLLVVVLGGAGGYASWWMTTRYAGQLTASPTTTTTTDANQTPTPSPTEFRYAPGQVREGDCMINRGTQKDPEMWVVPCDREGAYKVLKVFRGERIPEDDEDNFTSATAEDLCGDLPSDAWFGYNAPNNANDYFYCMTTDVT